MNNAEIEELFEKIEKYAKILNLEESSFHPYQIVDSVQDLSGERLENVYSTLEGATAYIVNEWNSYGRKPNIVVDGKIYNVIESLETHVNSIELIVLFFKILNDNEIEIKTKTEKVNTFLTLV